MTTKRTELVGEVEFKDINSLPPGNSSMTDKNIKSVWSYSPSLDTRFENSGSSNYLSSDIGGQTVASEHVNTILYKNFIQRILTFKNSPDIEAVLPFKSYHLASNGYFLLSDLMKIFCSVCAFKISVDDIKRNPDRLVDEHNKYDPNCENVLADTLKSVYHQNIMLNGGLPRDANLSDNVTSQPFTNERTLTTSGAASVPTSELLPTQSDSRLPVPVLVKAVDGRLATDTVMVRSSGRTKPETRAYPSARDRSQSTSNRRHEQPRVNAMSTDLLTVAKPTSRLEDYDTYEGRLRSYMDWPLSSPVTPEELARAGFYYTHYSDKTKCPYCMGAIYNWEENDTAFGEHSRHYPHCDFLKYFVYIALSTPCPVYNPITQHESSDSTHCDDSASVKAVVSIGYPLSVIRDAVNEMNNKQQLLSSDNILDTIYEFEKKNKCSLIDFESIVLDSESELANIEGAIGGLNLNEENRDTNTHPRSFTPCSDRYEDLYASNDNLHEHVSGNVAGNMDTEIPQSRHSNRTETIETLTMNEPDITEHTQNVVSPKREATGTQPKVADLDPETIKVHEEYQRLQKSNICNSCHKNPVDTLFLPCRHLVACEECAEKIEECLDCQEEIIGTVKVYLT